MNRIFSVVNHKGGVGKSTCTDNIAFEVSRLGNKVLVIDCDPQGNATAGFGYNPYKLEKTLSDFYPTKQDVSKIKAEEIILKTNFDNLHLIPANLELATVERNNMPGSDLIIHRLIQQLEHEYDYVFLDTPPSLGQLTTSTFVAATDLLIPIQCEYYALIGVTQILNLYRFFKNRINNNLKVAGAIITMYDHRNNLSKETVESVKGLFENNTFKSMIPRTVKISEAQKRGLPITVYAPDNPASQAFINLAKEVVA